MARQIMKKGGTNTEKVLELITQICIECSALQSEQSLAEYFLRVIRQLYPTRQIAIRLFEAQPWALTAVAVTDKLQGAELHALPVRIERMAMDDDFTTFQWACLVKQITIDDHYWPLFKNNSGFTLPLLTTKNIVGLINIEGKGEPHNLTVDRNWLKPLVRLFTRLVQDHRSMEHQIIQADKLATLGQIAAGVVHEINNPLTSVTVYADYLVKKYKREAKDQADIAKLEKILEGSNRILKCARDLVNYAKPSGEQIDVLSLNDIIEQSISFCEHVLGKTSTILNKKLASELPPFYGVQDQLQQVAINLITNACQALPSNGGEISIRTFVSGPGTISFEVEDSGVGIKDSDLPHIFEPFFTTKMPGDGTGLGLSIVKRVVDFHKGHISVFSQPGKLTSFCITLPTGHFHQEPK